MGLLLVQQNIYDDNPVTSVHTLPEVTILNTYDLPVSDVVNKLSLHSYPIQRLTKPISERAIERVSGMGRVIAISLLTIIGVGVVLLLSTLIRRLLQRDHNHEDSTNTDSFMDRIDISI